MKSLAFLKSNIGQILMGCIGLGLLALVLWPRAPALPTPGVGSDAMNGYSLSQVGDFGANWQLVTVRYRKDTGEMRFVYANPLAWKTMSAGRTDYADGAVFAKIGIMTDSDPAFESSATPSGRARYQLMVHDSKKHADMHGWGYAIFSADGRAMSQEDPAARPEACNACHEMVPERNYVFSQPAYLHVAVPGQSQAPPVPLAPGAFKPLPAQAFDKHVTYATESVTKLPNDIHELLPPGVKEVRTLHGQIEKFMFQGTINEMRPEIVKQASTSGLPALLMKDTKDQFLLAFRDPQKPDCKLRSNKKGERFVVYATMQGEPEPNEFFACVPSSAPSPQVGED